MCYLYRRTRICSIDSNACFLLSLVLFVLFACVPLPPIPHPLYRLSRRDLSELDSFRSAVLSFSCFGCVTVNIFQLRTAFLPLFVVFYLRTVLPFAWLGIYVARVKPGRPLWSQLPQAKGIVGMGNLQLPNNQRRRTSRTALPSPPPPYPSSRSAPAPAPTPAPAPFFVVVATNFLEKKGQYNDLPGQRLAGCRGLGELAPGPAEADGAAMGARRVGADLGGASGFRSSADGGVGHEVRSATPAGIGQYRHQI